MVENSQFQDKRSYGIEDLPNADIAVGNNPGLRLVGGIYRATPPTYSDGENAILNFTADGKLKTDTSVNLSASDIEIGAVEIKNGSDDTRVTVTSANQLKVFDNVANSLVPSQYDYVSLGYTGDNLTTVLYKNGGSGGTLVSTLTLAYTGSVLISVTKS